MKCRRHIVSLLACAWRYHPILVSFRSATTLSKCQFRIIGCLKVWKMLWSIGKVIISETMRMNITNSFRRENVNRHRRLTNFMVTQNSKAWKLPTWFLCVCSLPDANIHPMGRERRKSNRHTLSLSRMQIALISQSIQRSLSAARCTKIRRCSKMI